VRIVIIKILIKSISKDVEKREDLHTAGGSINEYSHGKNYGMEVPQKIKMKN
jgi:hypothetical protein